MPAPPSITVANDFNGAPYIRGGAPEDNVFYVDRSPIGYPYHFGGLVSTLSSELLERIDVYAGGFGAEFGTDAQAIIDIYSREGNEQSLSRKLNTNLIYSEGLLEGPLGDKGSWYLDGRRSYVDLLPIEVDQITAFPRFWDYQFKATYNLNAKHEVTANAFAADDFIELKLGLDDGWTMWFFRVTCGNATCYRMARSPYEFKSITKTPNYASDDFGKVFVWIKRLDKEIKRVDNDRLSGQRRR